VSANACGLEDERDLGTVGIVEDAFAAAEAVAPQLAIDLTACEFMGSIVNRASLDARKRAQAGRRRIVLVVGDQAAVSTILRISGIGALFEVRPMLADALGA
jgi:anti-anti-sigma regulatory factor